MAQLQTAGKTAEEIKSAARRMAKHVQSVMRRNGWGLGDVAYYFREDADDLVDDGFTEAEARDARRQAEDLVDQAEGIGAELS